MTGPLDRRRRARAKESDAQLRSAVRVLAHELQHLLVTRVGYTQEQAEATVWALVGIDGLREKLTAAA